jgi:hypothetical protein
LRMSSAAVVALGSRILDRPFLILSVVASEN